MDSGHLLMDIWITVKLRRMNKEKPVKYLIKNKRKDRANNRKLSRWIQKGKVNYRSDFCTKTGLPRYEVTCFFIDSQKAYDCIYRESILKILKEFQLTNKLINLIK